jgi:hypothetical protein
MDFNSTGIFSRFDNISVFVGKRREMRRSLSLYEFVLFEAAFS